MKGLLKTAVLLATFCATAMACGGGGEDALDHKGGDGGGTGNKGDQEEPEQPFVAPIKKNRNNHLLLILLLSTNSIKVSR